MSQNNIRNFVIISHIDHGKSTLADRFLEWTQTISKDKMKPQYLDMMDLEREKGITIKMQPVRMAYTLDCASYILNLIDTPGHVDFTYEVSRSLAAVEGAILLVDATKGIQAQTLANLELAQKQGLVIIPAVNKIDLPQAQVPEVQQDLANLLKIDKEKVFTISAKLGTNIEQILRAVVEKIPPPVGSDDNPFKALVFDSEYDSYKGIVAYVRVVQGRIENQEGIYLMAAETNSQIKELGYFRPEFYPVEQLTSGEIGYIATGIKEPGKIRVGDTIIKLKNQDGGLEALPGYREPQSVVFASIYPEDSGNYDFLKEALFKLKLNDAALTFEPESKSALGRGFRCGFLGSLHAEIIVERLRREFGINLVVSIPSVVYKIIDQKNQQHLIYSPADWLDPVQIKEAQEPFVRLEVMMPANFLGKVLEILEQLDAKHIETRYFGTQKLLLTYEVPLRDIIVGFYDNLKGCTQGYASMNYQILDYRPCDLVRLEILVAGQPEESFSQIVSRERAYREGSKAVKKLKEILPPQLFSIALQARVQGRIIARETLRARGKDVIAPLYGGDYTRKRKLLEKQKKGKQKLKERGQFTIPPKVYLEMLKKY